MNIFEINEKIYDFLATHTNEETGEIENIEEFEQLNMLKNEKIENTALLLKDKKALLTALKEEKKNYDERIKSTEKMIERIENLLNYTLQGQKFSSAKCEIGYRKSTRVEVDEEKLPNKYKEKVVTYKTNKTALKKLLEDGVKVKGASLKEYMNMWIK